MPMLFLRDDATISYSAAHCRLALGTPFDDPTPLPLAALALLALALSCASAAAKPIARARWLGGVTVTEYYPVPEAWYVGRKVSAPGLTTRHRIDWLYSATGLSMQGTGIGLDGRSTTSTRSDRAAG